VNIAVTESLISARLDALPGSRRLWTMIAILSFGAFFEIYDVALTAPLSLGLQQVGIFRQGAGALFGLSDQASFGAATFLGLWLGTIGFSGLADRLGRRAIFTWSLLWYAVATIAMGLQTSALMIDFWRLVAGAGVGVELVAIDCYITELMPKALRGTGFAISTSIQFLAAPVVALLAWCLLPGNFFEIAGWRWLCFVPAIGAVLVWFVRLGLPESPRWLAARGRLGEANAIVARLEGFSCSCLPPESTAQEARTADAKASPSRLPKGNFWAPPLRRRTIMMMVFHVFQVIGFFGFSNWLPTLLVADGITVTKSLGYSFAITLSMPLAPLMFATIADRFERKWQIVIGTVAVALFGLCFSTLTKDSRALNFILLGLGIAISNNLMSYSYHTYQSELFPTSIRARAVGFVYSFSRLSAVLSGFVIAFTLAHWGTHGVFLLISGTMVIAGVVIALLGPRTRARSAEEAL
jgi:putative MFS transporter